LIGQARQHIDAPLRQHGHDRVSIAADELHLRHPQIAAEACGQCGASVAGFTTPASMSGVGYASVECGVYPITVY
jgi:hypothetical protein